MALLRCLREKTQGIRDSGDGINAGLGSEGGVNYYPHHIGDFNNATRHLTRVERSLYRDLIELYYDTERPLNVNNMEWLCKKVLAVSNEEIDAVGRILVEFFVRDGDVWRHERCDEEIANYKAKISGASKAGKASAERMKNNRSTSVKRTSNVRATNQEPITSNQEPGVKKNGAAAPSPELPPEWGEFEQHRKEKRQSFTPTARKACIKKLSEWRDQGHDIIAILRYSIDNGYTGLFPPQLNGSRKPNGNQAAIAQAEKELFGSNEERDITHESERV